MYKHFCFSIVGLLLLVSSLGYAELRDPTRPLDYKYVDIAKTYSLNAIIGDDLKRTAIISNKFYHIGDQLGDGKISNITTSSVELDSPTGKIVLELLTTKPIKQSSDTH